MPRKVCIGIGVNGVRSLEDILRHSLFVIRYGLHLGAWLFLL